MSAPLKVLLVEDHQYSREAMGMWLEQQYRVLSAENGVQALELLKAHPDVQILVTDWMMPLMDGIELCRQARSLERDRYLHIIVFTARTAKEDLLTALQAGADAFVHKPVDLSELDAQMKVARRIIDLQDQAERRMEELTEARRQVDQDLEAAGKIQRSLLPSSPPPVPGVRFAWAFESSSQVGGDMFDVVDLGEGKIGIYVMDVCGAGAHAALLAVSIGWVLSPSGLLCTRNSFGSQATSPGEVARELNRRFPVLARSDQYFTLVYGVLDTRTLSFEYVRAGHPAPILLSENGPSPFTVVAGPPLGVIPDSDLEVETEARSLSSGNTVILYTDGLLRALGEAGRPASEGDLARFLHGLRGQGVEALVEALHQQVRESRPEGLEDDVAVVGFEILPFAQSGSSEPRQAAVA